MEYVGPAYEWAEEIVRGSLEDSEFTVWYLDGDRLAGALAVDRSDDLELARELIKSGENPWTGRNSRPPGTVSADGARGKAPAARLFASERAARALRVAADRGV